MMVLQTDEAFRLAVAVGELAHLLSVEAHGDFRADGFNFVSVPLADQGHDGARRCECVEDRKSVV